MHSLHCLISNANSTFFFFFRMDQCESRKSLFTLLFSPICVCIMYKYIVYICVIAIEQYVEPENKNINKLHTHAYTASYVTKHCEVWWLTFQARDQRKSTSNDFAIILHHNFHYSLVIIRAFVLYAAACIRTSTVVCFVCTYTLVLYIYMAII